jgi:hypothetical protein
LQAAETGIRGPDLDAVRGSVELDKTLSTLRPDPLVLTAVLALAMIPPRRLLDVVSYLPRPASSRLAYAQKDGRQSP